MIPLSFAQSRLWFLGELEGPSATYNVSWVLRLSGVLNVSALQDALNDVVGRHESLRTVFPSVDGEPYQRVLPATEARVELHQHDVEQAELDARIAEAAAGTFDLAREIPVRGFLFRARPEEHVLLLHMHHIASDGWSRGPLARDLTIAYSARAGGGIPAWEPLPVQYTDYTLWQRELLGSETDPDSLVSQQLEYWRGQLAGLPEELQLPVDRPRPTVADHRGGIHRFEMSADLHARLSDLARENQCTMFMVMQAALAALLTRLGAGTDIPIGSVIAGRTEEDLEDLIGFFVNTLVLRNDTTGDPTFRQLLERVRTTDLDAYAHQDIPFERLVEDLNPTRTAARHPLFQIMLAFQNNDHGDLEFPGVQTLTHDVAKGMAKFDLDFGMTETHTPDRHPAGITAHIEYISELFDRSTVERLAERYIRILEAATSDPDQPISQADILAPAERELLLHTWNDTTVPHQDELSIHELVEQQTTRTPDAIAVVCGDTQLTYKELNTQANQLAHHLISQGTGTGTRVAVCLERGPDMIVALLGILKSGAAYVPLDPDYPQQRLEFMLNDTQAATLITQTSLAKRLPADVPQILIDNKRSPLTKLDNTNIESQAGPSDLAYIIYTSGSTGTPKGVMIEHRSLSNRLQEMRQQYALTETDRTLQFASVSFDAAAEQIFPTLMSGGRIVLRDSDKWTASRIIQTIRKTRITVAELTPSLWQQLLPHLEGQEPLGTDFRLMILGGEQIPPNLLDQWFEQTTTPIHNTYGPTETTITATSHLITHATPNAPIGRPIANTETYVMDPHGGLAPLGTPGELWIGGTGIARGYWNRPELTKQKFVPHPFTNNPQARLYRTGDLVRWLPDGNLEFLGRIDQQIKLRGLRIELGEIETALTTHPDITTSIVTVREDTPGDKRLIAYLVPTPHTNPTTPQLRNWCKKTLPDYMIPGWFITIPTLPLTPNGKIDHKALPQPDNDRPELTDTYTPPRTTLETTIANIWSDILGINHIGIHDNFFELGGHSLLATRVVNRIESLTGLEISLRDFFQTPTVGDLAQRLQPITRSRPTLRRRTLQGDNS